MHILFDFLIIIFRVFAQKSHFYFIGIIFWNQSFWETCMKVRRSRILLAKEKRSRASFSSWQIYAKENQVLRLSKEWKFMLTLNLHSLERFTANTFIFKNLRICQISTTVCMRAHSCVFIKFDPLMETHVSVHFGVTSVLLNWKWWIKLCHFSQMKFSRLCIRDSS